jgi:ABC-type multidrug transport system ATPase subunit
VSQPSASFSLTVKDLSKRFNREWIFKNLSLQFLPGNTYAITGPNGSGKSTLLQVLWGQVPPTSGELHYSNGNEAVPLEEVYKHIGIATPYMDLIDEFSLQEQLEFHFKLKTPRSGMSLDEMMQRMYLTEARDKYISNFSSGMRQRLRLALAFYTEASLLFLDEPTTNLDQKAFDWYQTELKAIPSDTAIFIASNQPAEYPKDARIVDITKYK